MIEGNHQTAAAERQDPAKADGFSQLTHKSLR